MLLSPEIVCPGLPRLVLRLELPRALHTGWRGPAEAGRGLLGPPEARGGGRRKSAEAAGRPVELDGSARADRQSATTDDRIRAQVMGPPGSDTFFVAR